MQLPHCQNWQATAASLPAAPLHSCLHSRCMYWCCTHSARQIMSSTGSTNSCAQGHTYVQQVQQVLGQCSFVVANIGKPQLLHHSLSHCTTACTMGVLVSQHDGGDVMPSPAAQWLRTRLHTPGSCATATSALPTLASPNCFTTCCRHGAADVLLGPECTQE